ncbi:hypothetical protein BB559_002697 [Furculomyces boomerangus]|uniref:Uncharacterized protein n=1 Tax=Furculomyces boomerangus TaxID=61424 RepID=A0A2T9YT62_9FUNG|nr:hypothetical protein BB559_002697 [Furculomyces boomerangus]
MNLSLYGICTDYYHTYPSFLIDIVSRNTDDYVIQNVSNGGLNFKELEDELKGFGADIVINESELDSKETEKLLGDLDSPIMLAIDCDIVSRNTDDYVIQNVSNGGISHNNVVGKKLNFKELEDELKGFGADIVIKESELNSKETEKLLGDLDSPIRLAINCVCWPTWCLYKILDQKRDF